MYSPNHYIEAAMHSGTIDPQKVIDRMEDRHKAALPEVGINSSKMLADAKSANLRRIVSSLLYLVPAVWIAQIFVTYPVGDFESFLNEGFLFSYLSLFLYPLLLTAGIGWASTAHTISHLRNSIMRERDVPDNLVDHNVVTFGGFSPFAGYGIDLDGWSFTIDTQKPKLEGGTAEQFTPNEMLDYVASEIATNIPDAAIQDKIFVNGMRIRNRKEFLSNYKAQPAKHLESSLVAEKIGDHDQDARHYRVLNIPLCEGQLQITSFFRASMLGDNLFVECRIFLLLPLSENLCELDQLPAKRGLRYHMSLLLSKLLTSPVAWLKGPFQLLVIPSRVLKRVGWAIFGHPEDKLKRLNENYNYGNVSSLREEWASKTFRSYFQIVDKDMATKTSQHIIINSIVDFLDKRGIETGDIKERRTQIFNSGVVVSGGTLNANQLAVGTGASVLSKVTNAFAKPK